MAENSSFFSTYIIALFIMTFLVSPVAYRLSDDAEAIRLASTDYGHIHTENPAAVLYPSSIHDISTLLKFANNVSVPFGVAAKGQGHSTRGQAMTKGVVVEMSSLRLNSQLRRIEVASFINDDDVTVYYADVGGEQLWVDVMHATLEHGLSPVTWTDYLYLTVGGTLSNAGIGGQTFRFGPQISNVYEMDVVTGEGDLVTCSPNKHEELFYGVLGGLGQFGVISKARIALELAPLKVKWVRMLYSDFASFSKDQERLISINGRQQSNDALDYLEGSLLIHQGPPDNWRASSFFPISSHKKIISKVNKYGIIYCLDVVKYYDHRTESSIDKEVENVLKGLNYIPGYKFENDVSYVDFLNRVRSGELKLQAEGLWEVPHPWLNLFIPKSRIHDFNQGVFRDIVLKRNITTGPVLVYPMNKSKWNERMSAVVPEEDVFYTVGFLHATGFDKWEEFDEQNKEILEFCVKAGIEVKEYLPNHKTEKSWMKHFGSKWKTFEKRKAMFDPKRILSPGQRIFQIKE